MYNSFSSAFQYYHNHRYSDYYYSLLLTISYHVFRGYLHIKQSVKQTTLMSCNTFVQF